MLRTFLERFLVPGITMVTREILVGSDFSCLVLGRGQVAGDSRSLSCKRLRQSEFPELIREATTAQLELIPNPPQAPSTPSQALHYSQIMKDEFVCWKGKDRTVRP